MIEYDSLRATRAAFLVLIPLTLSLQTLRAQDPARAPEVLPPQPGKVQAPPGKTEAGPGQPVVDKRAFGVLPNYRTANQLNTYIPLTVKQKFTIATKDSFDPPVFFTTAFFTGISALEGSDNQVFHGGVVGFAHRYAIEYADQTLGNYFPEAIVPSMFHLDPRYFRKAEGRVGRRILYALSRGFVCKNDNGEWTFNTWETLGNAMAASAAMTYHPHERTIGDAASEAGTFIESDLAGNVIKEFWPDVKRHFKNRHNRQPSN